MPWRLCQDAARIAKLLVKKINSEEVYTDDPMPKIDRAGIPVGDRGRGKIKKQIKIKKSI